MEQKIEDFWEWFELNNELIIAVLETKGHPQTEKIIEQLNHHILGMGKFKWDIKEITPLNYQLILSPNNDRDLLGVSKCIVSNAPNLPSWTFLSAQPAIELQEEVSLYDHEMNLETVSSKNWLVHLSPGTEKRFELTIQTDNTQHLDEDTEWVAADLLLNGLIGEEKKISALAGLTIVSELSKEELKTSFQFKNLVDFFSI